MKNAKVYKPSSSPGSGPFSDPVPISSPQSLPVCAPCPIQQWQQLTSNCTEIVFHFPCLLWNCVSLISFVSESLLKTLWPLSLSTPVYLFYFSLALSFILADMSCKLVCRKTLPSSIAHRAPSPDLELLLSLVLECGVKKRGKLMGEQQKKKRRRWQPPPSVPLCIRAALWPY